ncbi:tetratricopeptide repeat protein [Polaribacter sp.]|uniref:tetratricopeptide repeat protein n=1 Tax=Polaribacter sp. TaxID=1920175 RepID=UPI0035C7BA70
MKKSILILFLLSLCISCSSSKNSEEFVNKAEGRYLFNANEVLEVYFKEQELYVKWRGRDDIKPLKVSEKSFYMKEMNEKMIFITEPTIQIKLAEKTEHKGVKYHFKKMAANEKTPHEYFANKEYKKALEGYLKIKKQDSLNPVIREYEINGIGYSYLREKEFEKAIEIFKINTVLHSNSSNTFDSLAEAYLSNKDTTNAIVNYKKALSINSENKGALRSLKKITK